MVITFCCWIWPVIVGVFCTLIGILLGRTFTPSGLDPKEVHRERIRLESKIQQIEYKHKQLEQEYENFKTHSDPMHIEEKQRLYRELDAYKKRNNELKSRFQ